MEVHLVAGKQFPELTLQVPEHFLLDPLLLRGIGNGEVHGLDAFALLLAEFRLREGVREARPVGELAHKGLPGPLDRSAVRQQFLHGDRLFLLGLLLLLFQDGGYI